MESTVKQLTLPDLLPGGATYSKFCPTNLETFWWGNELIQLKNGYFFHYNNGNWQTLFGIIDIKAALNSCDSAKGLGQLDVKFRNFSFPLKNESIIQCTTEGYFTLYNWTQEKIESFTKLPEKSQLLSLQKTTFCMDI